MFKKSILTIGIISAFTFSYSALAEEYQTFIDASVVHNEATTKQPGSSLSESQTAWRVGAAHYLDPRPTLGPLSEFDFINEQSVVNTSIAGVGGNRLITLGGEFMMKDWVIFGESNYETDADNEITTLGFGYFITRDFKLSVSSTTDEGLGGLIDSDESVLRFSADYVMQMEGNDYLGFSYTVDDEFDLHELNSKYFRSLSGGRYLVLNAVASVFDDDFFSDESLDLGATYYFNDYTSVGAGFNLVGDDDTYSIFARHFFNNRSSISFSYANNQSEFVTFADDRITVENDVWNLSYSYQF